MFVKVASDIVVKLNYDCEMLNYIASFLLIFASGFSYGQSDEFLEMEALAESGDVEAQFDLALMYRNGTEVPRNDKTAVKWYTKAAEQGLAKAQFNLGNMYVNGEGITENDKTAVKWFTKAAEQGLAEAQFKLGNYYDYGYGVPENDKTAVKWYTKAAEQGDAGAQSN
ncbi:sel1 repeat family protein, partial [Porticoccaceae bacterium]|nr:sel1 repeat family protein [Porticoccaceae bacterium]